MKSSEKARSTHADRIHRTRLFIAVALITACFVALGWRLYSIQILGHDRYTRSARSMRQSADPVLAYRGDIHLSDGVLVARDLMDYDIGIDPGFLSRERLPWLVKVVCDAGGKPPEYRRRRLFTALEKRQQGGKYVHLLSGVSLSLATEIRAALERVLSKRELRGFVMERKTRRTYPRGSLAALAVGVTDASGEGIEGVEKYLNPYLAGRDGRREVFKDATQKMKIFTVDSLEVVASSGYDVYLTVDSSLQSIVEEELEAGIERKGAEGGLFILMDCNSGDILALASYPGYDPNHFSEYPDEERKKRRANKVVESLYEPGSVIKPFYASYALERGVSSRERSIRELMTPVVTWDGGITGRFGRRTVRDVHEHPGMTFQDAVVHSSNIGMAILGLKLGRPGITETLHRFGFDRPTGIELPAEASRVPWSPPLKWNSLYSPVSAAFGYEIMISPIQLCRAFASLINGGYLLKPRLVDRVERQGGVTHFPTRQVESRPISEETSRHMREILRLVVEEGTARWLRVEGFEFGGKTGTADMVGGRQGYTKKDYLASFEAFAPFDDPQVVALCMVEKPRRGSYYGGMVAGPIVVEVFRRMFHVTRQTKLAELRAGVRN
jgi:cell division protein FtsI (penicillin-binding protein 3)